ncbi:hypothetical protein LWI28_015586 [Acer negundo]|uniref:Retroviral polymerase SH3-like domain-containing protein n=1 Tax=Acer negundo TaxID=4023 RepID=A0AAD5IUC4_ACENE|nr:hypothetical protein LWI28_015586 [Acer negundo]
MGVPKHFWHMATLTAIYFINCTSSRVVQGKAPLYLLLPNGTLFPLLSRVFGYTYFVQNRSPTRTKLDDKVIRCVFLGYSSMSKGYRCYDLVSRQFYHSLDVTFLEIVPFFSSTSTLSGPAVETSMEDSSMLSRPVPIFELYLLSFTSSRSLPLTIQDYSQHPYAQDPLPVSSLDSGILHPPLVYDVPPHYPTRDRCPLSRYLLSSITTLPIAKYISYQGIQDHYQSFLGQRWKDALKEASNLSGFDSSFTRCESEIIQEIVEDILKKLNDRIGIWGIGEYGN